MKLTNKYDLPQTLINLYEKQRAEYAETRGEADMSVTEIIKSPRISILRKKHFHEIEEDVSDRLWAILGTVIHKIMEEGADQEHIAELNLIIDVAGWKVKGGIDVVRKGNMVSITDYKFTKAYKYQKGDFLDWEEQLNCYAYLLRTCQDLYVDELQVVIFVKDFTQGLVGKQENYPPASSVPVDIPLWTEDEQREFIEGRVAAHQDARRAQEWGEDLPLCTDRDRWLYPGTYAVMKKGGQRAAKVEDTEKKAQAALKKMKNPDDYEVVLRQKAPARCSGNWCGVAPWCGQWQKEKEKWDEKGKD